MQSCVRSELNLAKSYIKLIHLRSFTNFSADASARAMICSPKDLPNRAPKIIFITVERNLAFNASRKKK